MIGKSERATGHWTWLAAGMLMTALAGSVGKAAELPAEEMARQIDAAIEGRLKATSTPLSPQADDAEFIRRIHLDLHGLVPTTDRVVGFLNNTRFAKAI